MAKSFNEMSNLLRDLIKDMNSDAHNSRSFKEERYNNLKMTMDPTSDANPHVIITIGVSEAKYSITTMQRINGSLGPDEKYINRWFNRVGVIDSLKDLWKDTCNKDKETVNAEDIEDIEELKSKDKEKKKKHH
jgi:hypothetical protein